MRVKPYKNTEFDVDFPQSGAILIDKPEGITSNDVAFKIRKALSTGLRLPWGFKIGHGGTLDPFATGLMVIFYGEATKLANSYLRSKKAYSGRIALGAQTDTADYTGTVTAIVSIPDLGLGDWQTLAQTFVASDYHQTPPMYSAKKIDGMALHHIARQGREIEREAILKKIEEFKLMLPTPEGIQPPAGAASAGQLTHLDFNITCESGTYVRTIAEDLAKKAGTLAHLASLRRTASSDFGITEAEPLDKAIHQLSRMDASISANQTDTASLLSFVKPIHQVANHLPSLGISIEEEKSLRSGSTSCAKNLIEHFQTDFPKAIYGVLRSEDGFPVGLIHEFKLQRILLRSKPA